jgi:type IV pilus assembly protein PilE
MMRGQQGETAMRKSSRGVTLIELMTVTFIIAILTAIAVPSYRQYVLRTNRTDAKTALTSEASLLERCFTRYTAYNSGNCSHGLPMTVSSGTYKVQFSTGEPTVTTFKIEAVPQGNQAKDTKCGTFTTNQANVRTAGASDCWGR